MEATKSQPRPRTAAHDYNYNNVLCARSVALLQYHLLSNGILPSTPVADIRGYDIITDYLGRLNRVQVRAAGLKGNAVPPEVEPGSFTFSIIRNKKKRKIGDQVVVERKHFHEEEVDAFIFIHVDYQRIYIVPVDQIDLTRTKYTVHTGGKWQNAYRVLK